MSADSAKRIIEAAAVFLFVTAIVLIYGGASSGDDTFIYMRYLGNALNGHGFTFNPGEPSYGCTSALWAFVMLPIAKVFGNNVWTWKIAGGIFFGLRASILYVFIAQFGVSYLWRLLLTVAVVAEPHTFRWGSSGMENSLAVLLLTLAAFFFWRYARKNSVAAGIQLGIIAGLQPFVRPEFALVSLGILGFIVVHGPTRSRVTTAAAIVVVAALMLILVRLSFGAFVPQTAAAKAIFLRHSVRNYAVLQCAKIIGSGCAGFVLVLIAYRRKSREIRVWSLIGIVCCVGGTIYLSYNNQLVSTRYASYLCAPIALAAAVVLAERVSKGVGGMRSASVLIALQVAMSIAVLIYVYPATRASDYKDIKQVADLVASVTNENARVATTEIGAIAFYSNRYIIDLDGLTDRQTLDWAKANGRISDQDSFESLLIARGATIYIDPRKRRKPLLGHRLTFTKIGEANVNRDIMFEGEALDLVWRVYKIDSDMR